MCRVLLDLTLLAYQINTVVEQLKHESRYLYLYLDALHQVDSTLVEPYADTMVELYAEHNLDKLEGYLRTSVRYNLEKVSWVGFLAHSSTKKTHTTGISSMRKERLRT